MAQQGNVIHRAATSSLCRQQWEQLHPLALHCCSTEHLLQSWQQSQAEQAGACSVAVWEAEKSILEGSGLGVAH